MSEHAPEANSGGDLPVNGITLGTTRKLWLSLALVTDLFVFVAIGQIQGSDIGPSVSAAIVFSFVPDLLDSIVAMWGITILAVLLILNAAVMREHAERCGPTWQERYPFRLWDASPRLGLGRKGQNLAYVFFSVIPVLALLHFWRVFLDEGKLCAEVTKDKWVPVSAGGLDMFHLPPDATFLRVVGDHYRLAGEVVGPAACEGATTFFPLAQPMAMLLLSLFAVFVTFRALFVVGRGR